VVVAEVQLIVAQGPIGRIRTLALTTFEAKFRPLMVINEDPEVAEFPRSSRETAGASKVNKALPVPTMVFTVKIASFLTPPVATGVVQTTELEVDQDVV
jgi:hypothetical protein